jgi:hypothetical protein
MNREVFKLTGITKMHEMGIRGAGATVLIHERDKNDEHAYMSADIIKQVAPRAIVERWNPSQATYQADMDLKYPQFDIVNRSFSGDHTVDKARYNTIILSAAGNSEVSPSRDVLDKSVIGVGAVTLATNGKVYHDISGWNHLNLPMDQSVEFMGFTNLWTAGGMYGGTSCATPFISGILALIAGDYKAKGLRLTLPEARRLLQAMSDKSILKNAYSIDLTGGTKTIIGRESEPETDQRKIGYGYPNLHGYVSQSTAEVKENTVVLTIGSKIMKVKGKEKTIPVAPQIINGTTMLPLRAIAEAFGLNIGWDEKTKTVTIKL